MRILFATQSESLNAFNALWTSLTPQLQVERAGFVVADSLAYQRFLNDHPDFEKRGHALLKEWEVTSRRTGKPNRVRLKRYEQEIGGKVGLFGAIVADRRLYMGRDCTYSQDYRRRFSDDELLCILEEALTQTERLFDDLKPDLVISFICVTMIDYLVYLFARARGIRVLNLRPTRVGDRVTFGSVINDPSPEFIRAYRNIKSQGSLQLENARAHIARVREKHGRYEGVVNPSEKPALKVNTSKRSPLKSLRHLFKNYIEYRNSIAANDNHVPNPLRALFFAAAVNPFRARMAAHLLKPLYVTPDSMQGIRYAFYPLHTEPEVSLLVYGRPYVNQIEIIRFLAMSLPADMVLVIKEHPWMVGKRTLGVYRKLLNIPRVYLASPATEAREWIASAVLVAVVTGSVALEAAIIGKPVITFGDCPYNALPSSMVHRCEDPRRLQSIIQGLLNGYHMDQIAMEAYIAAVLETSESINLYSVLLQKRGVYSERETSFDNEIKKLADYVVRLVNEPGPMMLNDAEIIW